MYTSPTFEMTVLLWGDRWWLPGRSEPLEFQNAAHAVEVLAAHLVSDGRRMAVRLIYQPASFVSAPVTCPDGNRATLQRVLEVEHSALENPEIAWGCEPILPIGEEHSTILHHELEPGLFRLVEALRQRGIDVVGAWPLATFLHALPGEWSESGATAVLAIGSERALAYHHPSNGAREVKEWSGPRARSEALGWLAALPSGADTKLVVAAGNDIPFGEAEDTRLSFSRALAEPVILTGRHPAQLIPTQVAAPAERAALVAGMLMLLAGSWLLAGHGRAYWTGFQRNSAQQTEIKSLTHEIAHLRENESAIVVLRKALAAQGRRPPISELFDALKHGLPRTIALEAVRVTADGFQLEGFVAPGAADQLASCQRSLVNERWSIETAAGAVGGFRLRGKFLP